MGYKNERAVPNKYTGMKDYCEKNILSPLIEVQKSFQKQEDAVKSLKPTFSYRAKNLDNKVPVLAFDGGIATLFAGEPLETKLLKVASGFPPQWKDIFESSMEDFIHLYSGQLKWAEGVGKTLDEVIEESVQIICENQTIQRAVGLLELSMEDFKSAMISRFKHIKGKGAEDNVREVLELSAIVNMTEDLQNNEKLKKHLEENPSEIPYLLIKDGTLYPSKMTASTLVADAVSGWFNSGLHCVVGVVKNSRFVNEENSWSQIIQSYGKEVPSHTFFRINKKIELSIDPHSDDIDFRRYFLSLYGGKSMFEIQIPRVLSDDDVRVKAILDVIASQVTVQYGGSISTNSYAHANASLPEAEARVLSRNLRQDLKNTLQELKKSKETGDEES